MSVAAAVAYLYFPRSPVTSASEYVQLTNFTDSATAPVLSPDGRMVAFIRGGDYFLSSGQIYVKLLPNGDAIRLTDTPVPKLAPAFTADGSRVAYTLLDVKRNPVSWDTWSVPVYGGDATQLLPNAAGLVWLDEQRVMFSEMKPPGIHMGIVTSTEGRADHRDIYLPAHERAMAHYSWASPDRKAVLVVEMDRTAAWQQCRLVPFDGSSPGQLDWTRRHVHRGGLVARREMDVLQRAGRRQFSPVETAIPRRDATTDHIRSVGGRRACRRAGRQVARHLGGPQARLDLGA